MQKLVDPTAFRGALSRWASGVTIVTCEGPEGEPVGFTASSFSSLSLDPPLVLVCIDKRADSYEIFMSAPRWAISVLGVEQADVALKLATKGPNKFEGVSVVAGPETGLALFEGAIAHLECRAHERLAGGDHTILVGEVLGVEVREGEPLLHFHRKFGRFEPRGG
jgi:flavin reductase ActVB